MKIEHRASNIITQTFENVDEDKYSQQVPQCTELKFGTNVTFAAAAGMLPIASRS